YNWSIIQTLLSRGDRRLSHLLELTRGFGDSLGSYKRAFKEFKGKIPDLDFYVYSHWSTEKILPWNHLQGPLQQSTLIKHLHEATSHFRSASPVK
ncbi:MAG: radical SAM protein, partial [Sphaerospermopsis kisseleviana]